MPKQIFLSFTFIFLLVGLKGQTPDRDSWQSTPLYTSLEEALQSPENTYRLKLRIKADSLPEALFQLTNLRELTVARCKLSVLNERIGELKNLRYLNVSGNKLVRLPESIGELTSLQTLVISRNLIEALPNTIAELHELTYIDAWDNPLYTLPESIKLLRNTLKTIDLRQIDLRDSELEYMEELLPYTDIKFTSTCDCHSTRGK